MRSFMAVNLLALLPCIVIGRRRAVLKCLRYGARPANAQIGVIPDPAECFRRRFQNRHREAAKPPWRSSATCCLRFHLQPLDCFGAMPLAMTDVNYSTGDGMT